MPSDRSAGAGHGMRLGTDEHGARQIAASCDERFEEALQPASQRAISAGRVSSGFELELAVAVPIGLLAAAA